MYFFIQNKGAKWVITLYNSFGQRLSIAKKNNLYNKRGNHIGIIPNNTDVYNLQGKYLGTIVDNYIEFYNFVRTIKKISGMSPIE